MPLMNEGGEEGEPELRGALFFLSCSFWCFSRWRSRTRFRRRRAGDATPVGVSCAEGLGGPMRHLLGQVSLA